MPPRWIVAATLSLAAALARPAAANARATEDERYTFDLTWNAAVRLIRVDMGFAIIERDRDTGFVVFTYTDAGRATPGSLELIRTRIGGVDACRVVVNVPQMPTYVERHLLTRLARKLHDEYGDPIAPTPAPRETSRDAPATSDHDDAHDRGGSSSGSPDDAAHPHPPATSDHGTVNGRDPEIRRGQ
ncbi:MAG: hypothetical protein WCJ30_23465 [Deltaproteobacteria bacterium]